MSPWVQTYTGRAVDLLRPDPETVRLEDIATQLSRLARYSGATVGTTPYNVAIHSHWAEQSLPAGTPPLIRLATLFHDGHEAYTGDITRPVKDALPFAACNALREIESRLDRAIAAALGLDSGFPADERIHAADVLALAVEKRDLMSDEPREWGPLPDVSGLPTVEALPAWASCHVFIARTRQLVRECGLRPLSTFGLYE